MSTKVDSDKQGQPNGASEASSIQINEAVASIHGKMTDNFQTLNKQIADAERAQGDLVKQISESVKNWNQSVETQFAKFREEVVKAEKRADEAQKSFTAIRGEFDGFQKNVREAKQQAETVGKQVPEVEKHAQDAHRQLEEQGGRIVLLKGQMQE